jgi:hypothetical protein
MFLGKKIEQKGGVQKMAGLAKKLEKIFTAAAFAEAGEFDTAQDILREDGRSRKTDRISPTERPRKELRAPGIKR